MNCTDPITGAAHPAPPVPCDIDLRDFHFMPLDVVRLQNSETWAIADGWAAKALVNLWTRSWHQVPAGSLPDDDNLHRAWANVPDWESVRNVALRGFVKCSDGRLYHRVICAALITGTSPRLCAWEDGRISSRSFGTCTSTSTSCAAPLVGYLGEIDPCLDRPPELQRPSSHGGHVWIPVAYRLSELVLVASRARVVADHARSRNEEACVSIPPEPANRSTTLDPKKWLSILQPLTRARRRGPPI
jgi:hypothetical protein